MSFIRAFVPVARMGVVMKMKQSADMMIPRIRPFSTRPVVFEVESREEFDEKVVNSTIPVIVDFHADWCGPCLTLGPRLEAKVMGRDDVLMAKINVDYAGELATDYNITAVPTVLSFKDGEIVGGFQGVIDDDSIDTFIDEVVNY